MKTAEEWAREFAAEEGCGGDMELAYAKLFRQIQVDAMRYTAALLETCHRLSSTFEPWQDNDHHATIKNCQRVIMEKASQLEPKIES